MNKLVVQHYFDAAHQLTDSPDLVTKACARLHGHTYAVVVEAEAEQLNGAGMVIDFKAIKETIEGWKQMCKTYPYVALSIPELRIVLQRKYLKNFIHKMIVIANKINPEIKIHLLGCTSNDLLQQNGYYSADSTS